MEFDAISMNPISIPAIKMLVRLVSLKESKLLLAEALKQPTATKVIKLMQDTYGPSFPKAPFFQHSRD
jgi:phosphotransferase system enzyme I (PtsI)